MAENVVGERVKMDNRVEKGMGKTAAEVGTILRQVV